MHQSLQAICTAGLLLAGLISTINAPLWATVGAPGLGHGPATVRLSFSPRHPATARWGQDSLVDRVVFQVVSEDGVPLQNAEVFVADLGRRLRTSAAGIAVLERVPVGVHDLLVRRVGYAPSSMAVHITTFTSMITVSLESVAVRLAPVVSQADAGGLSGLVSDTAMRPLPLARVTVTGSGQRTKTDSTGRFHLGLRAGSYLVQIERDSFARQVVGITIPKDAGTAITVQMQPADGPPNPAEQVQLFELGRRMVRASPSTTKYFSRDALSALGITDMSRLARQWATGGITGECEVLVISGGQSYSAPLASVETAEVEFVEVSTPSIAFKEIPRGRTSINGLNRQILTSTGYSSGGPKVCGNVRLTVWLRS